MEWVRCRQTEAWIKWTKKTDLWMVRLTWPPSSWDCPLPRYMMSLDVLCIVQIPVHWPLLHRRYLQCRMGHAWYEWVDSGQHLSNIYWRYVNQGKSEQPKSGLLSWPWSMMSFRFLDHYPDILSYHGGFSRGRSVFGGSTWGVHTYDSRTWREIVARARFHTVHTVRRIVCTVLYLQVTISTGRK